MTVLSYGKGSIRRIFSEKTTGRLIIHSGWHFVAGLIVELLLEYDKLRCTIGWDSISAIINYEQKFGHIDRGVGIPYLIQIKEYHCDE